MLKLKIKIKYVNKDLPKLKFIDKGEWIDLYSAKELSITSPKVTKSNIVEFNGYKIPLNVCMQLPKHFEANIVPRSSSYRNYGILLSNNFGVLDNSYSGDNDEWSFDAIFLKKGLISVGDRIAQFRINVSQKAPFLVKLKWLFTSKIIFEEVTKLNNPDRGGFGSTGKQ